MDIFPVILCGVPGRLAEAHGGLSWASVNLLDDRSLLQHTALRLAGLEGGKAPIVVVGEGLAALAKRQLAEVGVEAFVIAEPSGRDLDRRRRGGVDRCGSRRRRPPWPWPPIIISPTPPPSAPP